MANWNEHYKRWIDFADLDEELRNELAELSNNKEILEDCFYKSLEFGTGGMRGELGPGPNRMNIYTVRKTSEGLARYVVEHGEQAKRRGVVIAYDSRHKSALFAREAAKVLGKHGIRVFLFDRLCPTPLLSFAVRYLHAFAGIVITASHNPPQYNGYKVYGSDGGQITPDTAARVMEKVNEVTDELTVGILEEATLEMSGQLEMIYDDILEAYLSRLQSIRLNPTALSSNLTIVFTPLHGTSYETLSQVLNRFGYQVTMVQEQAAPDPDFPNAFSLNPEEPEAFELAIQYAKQGNADLLIATDPDADRLGVAVQNDCGDYVVLTGNQVGALLLYYLLSEKKRAGSLPDNAIVLKTIVSSEMARAIACDFNTDTIDTLTGFKFIGEKMSQFEKTGRYQFLFGFEESNGYVIGDFVRDKDGIQAALMMAEMCAFYKNAGKSLYQVLLDLFAKYGFYREDLESITLKGKEGDGKIAAIFSFFRHGSFTEIAGATVAKIEDYLTGECKDMAGNKVTEITLPKSNVLKYHLTDGSWFCLRPSGTEPKMKLYFGVKGASLAESMQKLTLLKQSVQALINKAVPLQ